MSESPPPGLFGETAPAGGGYLVLARKYRPRTFADLIGQEAMVRTIANSFALNRIAHATMLTGVRGVGKTTTARLLARALNYRRGDIDAPTIDLDPPGEHCQAIMESRHPDVFEMDAASRTGINDIREILDSVRYAPVMARYKLYIIDEVHMLSTQAFNGLLDDALVAMNNVFTTQSTQITQTNTLINNLNDQAASASANTSSLDSAVSALQTRIQNHSLQISDLENRIASLSGFLMPISPIPSLATSGAQLTLDALDVHDATISGTLSVTGRTLLSDVGITGKINAGLLAINGLDNSCHSPEQGNPGDCSAFASINTLSGPLKLQSDGLNGLDILDGKITIDTKGNITTKGEITAKTVNTEKLNVTVDTTSSPSAILSTSAGSIIIPAGQLGIDVSTDTLTPKSLIFITPDQAVTIGAKAKDSNTFTIKLQKAQTVNIKVNWWIIN